MTARDARAYLNSVGTVTPFGRLQATFEEPQTYRGDYAKFLRAAREAGLSVEFTAEIRRGGNMHRQTADFSGSDSGVWNSGKKIGGISPDYLLYTSPPSKTPWDALLEFISDSPAGYDVRAIDSVTVTVLV